MPLPQPAGTRADRPHPDTCPWERVQGVSAPAVPLGLDYAGGLPGGAAIKAAGYSFVCRYLSSGGPGLPGKLLTAAEYADLMAHGVAVVVNWETTADRMKAGHDAGAADARQADTVARGVGHPGDRPIYFSADWDATETDQAAIDAYLRGAAEVLGVDRVGVYGSYYVVKRCTNNGTARWAWQTGAWSGGQENTPQIHLLQRIGLVTVGGVQCDVNEARSSDFGQYLGGAVTAPADVWGFKLDDPYVGPDGKKGDPKSAGDFIRWAATHAAYAKEAALAARSAVGALQLELDAVKTQLTAMDREFDDRVKAAVAQGVVGVNVTIAGNPLPTSS